jgi:hypothetical protein
LGGVQKPQKTHQLVPFFVIFRDFWPKFGILVVKTPIPETPRGIPRPGPNIFDGGDLVDLAKKVFPMS